MVFGTTQIEPNQSGTLLPPFDKNHALIEAWIAKGWLVLGKVKYVEVVDDSINEPVEEPTTDELIELKEVDDMTVEELRDELRTAEISFGNSGEARLRAMVTDLRAK